MSPVEPVGQDVSGGFARRLGRRLLDASDGAETERAVRRATTRGEVLPAYHDAVRAARAATEAEEPLALDRYQRLCGAWALGEVEESEVEEAERDLEAVRRDRARNEAAARALSERLGIRRDSTGARIDR
jgi:hypothetical protein